MNWKTIFIVSIIFNILLIMLLINKYNLSNHSSTEKIDVVLDTSSSLVDRHCDHLVRKIESNIRKTPKLKKPITVGIVKLRETEHDTKEYIDELISKIETIKNDSGEIDLERRVKPYTLLKENNDLEKLLPQIESTLDSIESSFDELMIALRKGFNNKLPEEFEEKTKATINPVDFEAKIKSLKNISLLETRMVLHSIQLDLSNISSIYLNAIEDAINLSFDDSEQFNRLKVIVHPKSTRVKLGEKYEAQLGIVKYFSSANGNAFIFVNDKEYPLGEDGLVHFKERPTKVGKRILNLKSKITNPLSGEVMTSSSSFEYNVLP